MHVWVGLEILHRLIEGWRLLDGKLFRLSPSGALRSPGSPRYHEIGLRQNAVHCKRSLFLDVVRLYLLKALLPSWFLLFLRDRFHSSWLTSQGLPDGRRFLCLSLQLTGLSIRTTNRVVLLDYQIRADCFQLRFIIHTFVRLVGSTKLRRDKILIQNFL